MSSAMVARFKGVRVVTFDAAGTLFVPHPSVGAVYREIALKHGCDFSEDALSAGFKAAFREVVKDPQMLEPEARERDFWQRIVTRAIAGLGTPPENFGRFFDELYETFAHAGRWRLLPGVLETLQRLRARGLRTAVISNWDRRLHTVLRESGLLPLFDAVVISSEVGCEKPEPGIFRAAERALDAAPAECLHVGDSEQHDLDGAHAAGWRAVLVRNSAGASDPHTISFLPELLAHLE